MPTAVSFLFGIGVRLMPLPQGWGLSSWFLALGVALLIVFGIPAIRQKVAMIWVLDRRRMLVIILGLVGLFAFGLAWAIRDTTTFFAIGEQRKARFIKEVTRRIENGDALRRRLNDLCGQDKVLQQHAGQVEYFKIEAVNFFYADVRGSGAKEVFQTTSDNYPLTSCGLIGWQRDKLANLIENLRQILRDADRYVQYMKD